MLRKTLSIPVVVLSICLLNFAVNKTYALSPVKEGEGAKLQELIQQQEKEKAAIAKEMQERKKRLAQKNALLVEKIKKEISETLPAKRGSSAVTLINIIAIILTVICLIFLYLTRRK